MDPLSVVASAVSLAQLCGAIVSTLKFIRNASEVEFGVHSLREEIDSLRRVLNRVAESFDPGSDQIPMRTPFQQKHEEDVRHLLDRSHNKLNALHQIISGLEGKKYFASHLVKQIQLNRVTQHITILKANIHSCREMLQVSLLTMSITMNRERHNDITDQLQDLSHAIWNVKKSLSSRNYQGFSRDPLTVDVKDYLTFVDEVEVEMHPPNLFEDDQEGKFLPVTGPTAPSRDLEEIEATPHDNVRGNKETLDWLRKNGFSTENLEVSRPKALRLAVREGQVAVLHGLVNQVSRTPARRALLADATDLAVSIGQLDVLQSLITTEGGLNIDSHLESGHTPLIAAITAGNHQTIECLLRHGADTEARCAQEITPLTHAVIARDQGIVQFLLHGKAHIDAKTWDWTPLHFAVDHGDREMVDLLLKNHANIEASCPRDFSQKTYTQPTGLERPIAVPSTEEVKRYCTPLFRASINEEDMMVHLLLERGANPEAKNSGQATALICAAEEQFEEIVELLLRYKARVDARDQWEWTPLHRAQVKQESELVTKLLLDYKADVEARCQKQRTPLHGAAEWGNTRTVPILLEYKADIEAKDSAERTPLHVAIEYRQTEMVIQLVKHGADVMARNGDGHHALAAAVHVEMQRRCPEIIAFLEEEDKKRTKRGKEGKEGKEEKEDEKKEEKTEDAQSSNGFKHPHPLV